MWQDKMRRLETHGDEDKLALVFKINALKMLMTGPVEDRIKKDGTRNESLLLYNTLGGEAYFDQVVAKAQATQIQDYSQQGQMASMQAQAQYNDSRLEAQKAGVLRDPAKAKAYFEQRLKLASEVTDYQSRNALIGTITEDQRAIEAAVIKPRQEATAARIANLMIGTEKDEAGRNRLSANLDVLLRRNEISTADYEKYKAAIAAQGNKDVRSYDKDIKDRMDRALKDWDQKSKSSNSYSGTSTVGYEDNARWKASSLMLTKSREVVTQALKDGKDPIEALNKTWATNNWGLKDYKDVVGSQPEMYKSSVELINSNTGWFSRNAIGGQAANNLRGQANKKRLYKEAPFVADVDLYLKGQPTENFKTLLKITSKPSVLILRQLQLHGIDADPAMVDRLRALDDQKISMAAPRRRPTPQQNSALNGIQIATGALTRAFGPVQALGNALTPAAQAQTAPPPPQARDMSMFYANPETPPKATRVAMAPPPPKQVNNFPARVTEVGYYAGGGGQDGVAGGRTANGEIYNPKKMTVAVQWTLRGKLLNKWLLVQDSKSGKTVRVWANDVGPLVGNEKKTGARHLDLSSAAFTKLFGSTRQGLGRIKYKIDPNQSGRP